MSDFLHMVSSHLTIMFVIDIVTDYAVFLVCALGLYLLMATGQVSLGHGGLVGIAAYAAGIMAIRWGWSPWVAAPTCAIVGAVAGTVYCVLFGLRLSNFYLVVATFAFGEMLVNIGLNSEFLGGALGLPHIPLISQGPLVAVVALLVLFLVWRIEVSRLGITMRAIRDSPIVAGSMGIDVQRTKLLIWTIAGMITGIGGWLYAHRVTYLTPPEFGISLSVMYILAVLIGGLRSFWGTVLGSAFVSFGPWITGTNDPRDRLMLYGLAMVLLMVLRPQGLWPLWSRTVQRQAVGSRPAPGPTSQAASGTRQQ